MACTPDPKVMNFTIMIGGITRHYDNAFSFSQNYINVEKNFKIQYVILYSHFCPALGPETLNKRPYKLVNLGRGLKDIIAVYLAFLKFIWN